MNVGVFLNKSYVAVNEQTKIKQKCIIVHPVLYKPHPTPYEKSSSRTNSAQLGEAEGLATAIDLEICHSFVQKVDPPKPATLFGSGVIETLKDLLTSEKVNVCIVNANITPVQQRNLEKKLNCKVLDRTGLILEIFGDRARSAEGRLQVELASLNHQMTRLVRTWTHLERQRGGLGATSGPGETQLEMDKRMIRQRIQRIKKDLEKVMQTRQLHRKSRKKSNIPVIALVGYTNAGKSTLFNTLTHANVLEKDMLFATLDPAMRMVRLPSGAKCILSDTVGFISDLPHDLVHAFHATLEEVNHADVVVHVRDISHPDTDAQAREVEQVMDMLDIQAPSNRRIEALNKVDLVVPENRRTFADTAKQVTLSAHTGEGVGALLHAIDSCLHADRLSIRVQCDPGNATLVSLLYKYYRVTEFSENNGEFVLKIDLASHEFDRLDALLAQNGGCIPGQPGVDDRDIA